MSSEDQQSKQHNIESRILVTMRQVLSTVIREITPQPGMRNPLSKETIQDVRECFSLIAARERELANAQKNPSAKKPRYSDEPKTSHTVDFNPAHKKY